MSGEDAVREAIRDELSGWPLGGGYYQYSVLTDEAREMADALLPVVLRYGREKAAEAIGNAADDWQRGAWGNTPRHADRVADRIGAAQYVTDWLRDRADALTAEDPT